MPWKSKTGDWNKFVFVRVRLGGVFIVTTPCSCGGDQVGDVNDDGLTRTRCTIHRCRVTHQVDVRQQIQRWTKLEWKCLLDSSNPDQEVLVAKRTCRACGHELLALITKGGTWSQFVTCPQCETCNRIEVTDENKLREALEFVVDEIRFDHSGFSVKCLCPTCHAVVRRTMPSSQQSSNHDPKRLFISCPDCEQLIPTPWFWTNKMHVVIHSVPKTEISSEQIVFLPRPTIQGNWKVVWQREWNGHHRSFISVPCPNCGHLMTSKLDMDRHWDNVLCDHCKLQIAMPLELKERDGQSTAPRATSW